MAGAFQTDASAGITFVLSTGTFEESESSMAYSFEHLLTQIANGGGQILHSLEGVVVPPNTLYLSNEPKR